MAVATELSGIDLDALRIEGIEVLVVRLPQRRPHPTVTGPRRLGEYVLVKLHAGGLVGLGEATVLKEWGGDFGRYYGEYPATTVTLIEQVLAPAIIGLRVADFDSLLSAMNAAAKGYPYAKASLEIAAHDLVGKAVGLPVYQLLGGAVRRSVPLAHSLGILPDSVLLEEAVAAVEEGARTLKLKVGFDPDRDVAAVAAVRAAVGEDITLTVDANRGWKTPNTAIRAIRRMEEHGLAIAEQPVQGLHDLAAVARAVTVDVMADESAWTAEDVLEIARCDAASLISIYTTKAAGLEGARRAAAVADAAGFACNVNGSHETGVGNAANLHLACALRNCTLACVLPVNAPADRQPTEIVGRAYVDDIVVDPFEFVEGALVVSERPGLGVELDPEKLAKYQVGSTVVV
jgi:muconate cycloisomerase